MPTKLSDYNIDANEAAQKVKERFEKRGTLLGEDLKVTPQMVYDILKTYAVSPRIEDNQVLFKIIEESVHPLMHNGDEDVAKKFEDKFCKLIGYDGYAIRDYKIKKISKEAKQDNDLDLYLKKKILVENWRDDLPHPITELSFTKNTMEQICYSLWDLFISDVIYFGANTFPENILIETDPRFHQEIAFNWQLIRDLDNNPHKVDDNYSFDIEVLDEKRLKRNIEEEIEEFIANKVDMSKFEKAKDLYPDTKFFETPSFSRGIPANYYAYKKQRKILLNLIANLYDKFENETLVINFNKINDKNVNVLRTILALEKEGFFTIKELRNDKNEWIDNDNVYAKISIDKKDIPIIKSFKLNNEDKAKTEKNKIDRLPVSESNLGTKEPFKVEVVGLQEGLKALGQSKEDKQIKFPFKLPAGTKWQDFIIKFLDDENISIQVKHIKHNVGYKGMGMVGKGKNPNPSEGWAFLKVLAVVNGELTIKDPEAKDKYKKQKELLAKELQSYFSLDYDPFYPYFSSPEKKGNSYKIKFTLIPPDKLSNETVTDDEEDDSLGIKEAYLEQTPRVYENQ